METSSQQTTDKR